MTRPRRAGIGAILGATLGLILVGTLVAAFKLDGLRQRRPLLRDGLIGVLIAGAVVGAIIGAVLADPGGPFR